MSAFLASGPNLGRGGIGAWLAGLSPAGKAGVLAIEVVVMLVVWQLVVGVFGWISPVFFPPPSAVVQGFGELVASGTLAANVLVSLQAWLTGFALAVVIGIPLGLLMGSLLPVDRVVGPIAWTIYATPTIAYQPLAKAWFGFGIGPVIFLVTISAVFPILLNVAAGIRTTNTSIIRAGRVYGASRMRLYRSVYLPSTVPFLFAGLRQAVVLATIGMVVAEMAGSSAGMGAVIMRAANTYQTDQAFAAIAIIVVWSVQHDPGRDARRALGRTVDEEGQPMTVTSATGTMRIVRPRRVVRSGEAKWTLLLIAVIATILLIWEAAVSWLHLVPEAFLPPPTAVFASFLELLVTPEFWTAFWYSIQNLAIGLVLAIVVGVVVGLAVGWSPVLRFTVAPFLWLLYSTPKVALAPLFILVLGLGSESKIALVFLLAVFPIILNTMEGAVTVSTSLVNAGRVYGVNGIALGWKVIFPGDAAVQPRGHPARRGARLHRRGARRVPGRHGRTRAHARVRGLPVRDGRGDRHGDRDGHHREPDALAHLGAAQATRALVRRQEGRRGVVSVRKEVITPQGVYPPTADFSQAIRVSGGDLGVRERHHRHAPRRFDAERRARAGRARLREPREGAGCRGRDTRRRGEGERLRARRLLAASRRRARDPRAVLHARLPGVDARAGRRLRRPRLPVRDRGDRGGSVTRGCRGAGGRPQRLSRGIRSQQTAGPRLMRDDGGRLCWASPRMAIRADERAPAVMRCGGGPLRGCSGLRGTGGSPGPRS